MKRNLSAWALISLVTATYGSATPSSSEQMPLSRTSLDTQGEGASNDWDLYQKPSRNATGHWIFDTFNSFLKLWPNTRLRNGHSIVAGVVPVGTLLYYGTTPHEIPTVPEWTATDPEHAYAFCRNMAYNGTGCWQLTMAATRPLRVLYFDGNSAAKMWGGPLDSQDILIWGGIQPNRTMDIRGRINDLCSWGKKYNLDGFVRMELDFEIMICDFTAGLEVVSFLNLYPVNGNKNPDPLGPVAFRAVEAGKWHDRFPSEQRIQIDHTRIISFYDRSLFPDLHLHRIGQERWDHRLKMITSTERRALRQRLDDILPGQWGISKSGVDWRVLLTVIEQRYSERLELLRYLLFDVTASTDRPPKDVLKQVHHQIKDMLAYYLPNSMYQSSQTTSESNLQWATPAFKECATAHTRYIETSSVYARLAHSEKLLLDGIKETSKEICRTLVGMWVEGVDQGLTTPSTTRPHKIGLYSNEYQALLEKWQERIQELMDWLDWSSWARCQPSCSYEETCYMPTWPFFKHLPRGADPRKRPNKGEKPSFHTFPAGEIPDDEPDPPGPDDDWYHPTPRCIRRLEPFKIT